MFRILCYYIYNYDLFYLVQTGPNMTFADFNLNDLIIQSLDNEGLTTPTPIQSKAIPVILKGDDVIGAAKTGTGKTAAFGLPIIERLIDGKLSDDNHIQH